MIQINDAGQWISAEQLKAQLSPFLTCSDLPELDLAGVTYLDGSCLQVMLSFCKTKDADRGQIKTANALPTLVDWFRFAGAEHLLNLSSVSACQEELN